MSSPTVQGRGSSLHIPHKALEALRNSPMLEVVEDGVPDAILHDPYVHLTMLRQSMRPSISL